MARKHSNVEVSLNKPKNPTDVSAQELTWSLLSFFERRTDLFHVMETPSDRAHASLLDKSVGEVWVSGLEWRSGCSSSTSTSVGATGSFTLQVSSLQLFRFRKAVKQCGPEHALIMTTSQYGTVFCSLA